MSGKKMRAPPGAVVPPQSADDLTRPNPQLPAIPVQNATAMAGSSRERMAAGVGDWKSRKNSHSLGNQPTNSNPNAYSNNHRRSSNQPIRPTQRIEWQQQYRTNIPRHPPSNIPWHAPPPTYPACDPRFAIPAPFQQQLQFQHSANSMFHPASQDTHMRGNPSTGMLYQPPQQQGPAPQRQVVHPAPVPEEGNHQEEAGSSKAKMIEALNKGQDFEPVGVGQHTEAMPLTQKNHDIVATCGQRTLFLHRSIVCGQSGYFRENTPPLAIDNTPVHMRVDEYEPNQLLAGICFMYCGAYEGYDVDIYQPLNATCLVVNVAMYLVGVILDARVMVDVAERNLRESWGKIGAILLGFTGRWNSPAHQALADQLLQALQLVYHQPIQFLEQELMTRLRFDLAWICNEALPFLTYEDQKYDARDPKEYRFSDAILGKGWTDMRKHMQSEIAFFSRYGQIKPYISLDVYDPKRGEDNRDLVVYEPKPAHPQRDGENGKDNRLAGIPKRLRDDRGIFAQIVLPYQRPPAGQVPTEPVAAPEQDIPDQQPDMASTRLVEDHKPAHHKLKETKSSKLERTKSEQSRSAQSNQQEPRPKKPKHTQPKPRHPLAEQCESNQSHSVEPDPKQPKSKQHKPERSRSLPRKLEQGKSGLSKSKEPEPEQANPEQQPKREQQSKQKKPKLDHAKPDKFKPNESKLGELKPDQQQKPEQHSRQKRPKHKKSQSEQGKSEQSMFAEPEPNVHKLEPSKQEHQSNEKGQQKPDKHKPEQRKMDQDKPHTGPPKEHKSGKGKQDQRWQPKREQAKLHHVKPVTPLAQAPSSPITSELVEKLKSVGVKCPEQAIDTSYHSLDDVGSYDLAKDLGQDITTIHSGPEGSKTIFTPGYSRSPLHNESTADDTISQRSSTVTSKAGATIANVITNMSNPAYRDAETQYESPEPEMKDAGVQVKAEMKEAGVQVKAEMKEAGVQAKAEVTEAGVQAKAEVTEAGVQVKAEMKEFGVQTDFPSLHDKSDESTEVEEEGTAGKPNSESQDTEAEGEATTSKLTGPAQKKKNKKKKKKAKGGAKNAKASDPLQDLVVSTGPPPRLPNTGSMWARIASHKK